MTTNLEARQAHVNELLKERKAGFHVEYKETWKNNCIKTGYTLIGDSVESKSICPLIYLQDNSNGSDESLVRFLIDQYDKIPRPNLNEDYLSRSYVVEHIYPKVVSRNNLSDIKEKGYVFEEQMDMLVLLYIDIDVQNKDARGSISVREDHLKMIDLSPNAAFVLAFANLRKTVSAMTMESALFSLTGEDIANEQSGSGLWVVSNTARNQGAASMFDEGTLGYLETIFSSPVVVLPSSIHEFIACPYLGEDELEHFLGVVKEINSTIVDPEELLTDNVYIYHNCVLQEAFNKESIAQLY